MFKLARRIVVAVVLFMALGVAARAQSNAPALIVATNLLKVPEATTLQTSNGVVTPNTLATDERFDAPLFRPRRLVHYNTNAMVPIQALKLVEDLLPGIRTNLLPNQLFDPMTNAPHLREQEIIRQINRLPGYIRSEDTNFWELYKEWMRTNIPPARPAN